MTREEIDKIFPPGYGGNAQMSDLLLILTYLASSGSAFGGIDFFEVATISDRDHLQGVDQGDICRVSTNNAGQPETYIWDDEQWKILVLVPSGGGGTSYPKLTEEFIVSDVQEQYQEINLINTPTPYEHIFVFLNGLIISKDDYTVVGNSVQFVADFIEEDDSVIVKYSYQP
jgi:hypothetical protein